MQKLRFSSERYSKEVTTFMKYSNAELESVNAVKPPYFCAQREKRVGGVARTLMEQKKIESCIKAVFLRTRDYIKRESTGKRRERCVEKRTGSRNRKEGMNREREGKKEREREF